MRIASAWRCWALTFIVMRSCSCMKAIVGATPGLSINTCRRLAARFLSQRTQGRRVWQLGFSLTKDPRPPCMATRFLLQRTQGRRGGQFVSFDTQGGGGGANVSMDRYPYRGFKSDLCQPPCHVLETLTAPQLLCWSLRLMFAIVGDQCVTWGFGTHMVWC